MTEKAEIKQGISPDDIQELVARSTQLATDWAMLTAAAIEQGITIPARDAGETAEAARVINEAVVKTVERPPLRPYEQFNDAVKEAEDIMERARQRALEEKEEQERQEKEISAILIAICTVQQSSQVLSQILLWSLQEFLGLRLIFKEILDKEIGLRFYMRNLKTIIIK